MKRPLNIFRITATASILVSCGLFAVGCAEAQSPRVEKGIASTWKVERSGKAWKVIGNLMAPANISAIAAIDHDSFLIGSDDLLVAQHGKIDRSARVLEIEGIVELLGPKSDDEIDIEAIASAPEKKCYYVTGSHSLTKRGNMNKERRSVFRVDVDSDGDPKKKKIERESLRDNLRRDPTLKAFWEKPQQLGGINIEGLAWDEGYLLFGLRSPNIDDNALVLQVNARGLFKKGKDPHKLLRVPLGDGLGIREMVPIKEGFLIIAGNAGDEPTVKFPNPRDYVKGRDHQLFFWDPTEGKVRNLLTFLRVSGRPEGILVLADSERQTELLVLFDGIAGGLPTHYVIHKNEG